MGENQEKTKPQIRWSVVYFPVIVFGALIILGLTNAETFVTVLWDVFIVIMSNFGWFVSLSCLFFMIFLAVMLFHPIGRIRFGGPHAKPEFSTWNWWAISLCAGIGTGIVFWGAVEPLLFTFEPAPGMHLEPGSSEAMMWAMRTSFLHWSFTPYAVYIIFAIVVAYAFYNMKKPYNISSGFVPLLGEKALGGKVSSIIDTLTIFAITGGVAGSLGYGIMQIGGGMKVVFGIAPSPMVYVVIAGVIIAAYTISSISGLNRGIKWISDKNAWIFIALMIFVLIVGPTQFILNLTTQSIGAYFNNIFDAMTYTEPLGLKSDLWPQWWDMYWWVDWISFAAIVGLFLVRLAYGRTIREFVVVNWVLPSVFAFIWFGIFGGFTLDLELNQGVPIFQFLKDTGNEYLMLEIFRYMPLTKIIQPVMIFTVMLSFVTLADSMTSTVSLMTVKNNTKVKEAPNTIKLGWGLLMGGTSLVFVLLGGLEGIKVVKTLAGFPIVFIEVVMLLGFIVYMAKRPKDKYGNYVYEEALREDIEKAGYIMEEADPNFYRPDALVAAAKRSSASQEVEG